MSMENVSMATKMEDVWHWLGYSRNSEMPLASLEIPDNDIVDNFQGAMELMPQEVEALADKVTKLHHLPFPKASDQEILQFEEILARNAKICSTNYGFKAKFMKATKITNVNLVACHFLTNTI